MGEEAFDEIRIPTSDGRVLFVRGGWGRESVWLGIATRQDDADPDVIAELVLSDQDDLIDAILMLRPS